MIPTSKNKSGVKLFPVLYPHVATSASGLQKTRSTSDSRNGVKPDWDEPEFGTSPFLHLGKKTEAGQT